MKLKSTLMSLALMLCLPLYVGCEKRSAPPEVSPPRVSPVGNAPASATPLVEGSTRGSRQGQGGQVKDWRRDDERPVKKKKKAVAVAAAKAASAVKEEKGPTEEEKRRQALERKVDGSLGAVMGALKGCFEAGGERGGKITLRFRVHRSGYVLSPAVTGVSAGSAACAAGILGKMKVTGNDVGTVDLVRTLNFERRTTPR